MKKNLKVVFIIALLLLVISACGAEEEIADPFQEYYNWMDACATSSNVIVTHNPDIDPIDGPIVYAPETRDGVTFWYVDVNLDQLVENVDNDLRRAAGIILTVEHSPCAMSNMPNVFATK